LWNCESRAGGGDGVSLQTKSKSPHVRGYSRNKKIAINEFATTSTHSLVRTLKSEYAIRFHMFLIVLTAIAIALLITKGLLNLGITEMWIRYAVSLVAAYATFFIGVWVWLHLSKYGRHLRAGWKRDRDLDFHGDVPFDFIPNIRLDGSSSAPIDLPIGGGGTFDGGGASGGWEQSI
jgi:hypothetical protein